MPRRQLSVIIAVAAALMVGACERQMHLSPAPIFGAAETVGERPRETSIAVRVPLDETALELELRQATRQRPVRVVRWLRRAGCQSNGRRCFAARIDGQLVVGEDIALQSGPDGRLRVSVPISYTLRARGLRHGRGRRERKRGVARAQMTFAVALSSNMTARITPTGVMAQLDGLVPVFDAQLDLSKSSEKLRRRLRARIIPVVREAVLRASLADGLTESWAALQRPILLNPGKTNAGPSWMVGEPFRLNRVGFSGGGNEPLALDADLAVRLRLGGGAAPTTDYVQPLLGKHLSHQSKSPSDEQLDDKSVWGRTTITMATSVPLNPLAARVADSIGDGLTVIMRRSVTSPEVQLAISKPALRPARRFLAISLDAKVLSPPRLAKYSGKVHLVGRPIFDRATETVRLQGLSFPVIAQSDARRPTSEIPLEASSLVERLAPLLSVGLKGARQATLEGARDLFRVHVTEALSVSATFSDAEIVSVSPSQDGLDVATSVQGRLVLTYRGDRQQAALRQGVMSSGLVDQIRSVANN